MEPALVRSELRADLTVLSICRDHLAGAQGPLSLGDLERLWTEYGVRLSDLPSSLARLSQRRYIDWKADATSIEVTAPGERWFSSLPAGVEYSLVVMRRRQSEARRKDAVASRPPVRRRRGDARLVAQA